MIARMSRMSEFNSKFGGGRDNCDAKDSISLLSKFKLSNIYGEYWQVEPLSLDSDVTRSGRRLGCRDMYHGLLPNEPDEAR